MAGRLRGCGPDVGLYGDLHRRSGHSGRSAAIYGGGLDGSLQAHQGRGQWVAGLQGYVGGDTHAGVNVTQENSVNLPAVYRCVSLNAETVASLPVDCMVKRDGKRKPFPDPQWVQKPNDFQDWGQFISQAQVS